MKLVYALALVAALFLIARFILPRLPIRNEYKRKLTHVAVGIGFFLLPYFVGRIEILILCAIFFAALVLSRYHSFLPDIHNVERQTLGEFYYPVSIAITAWLFLPDKLIAFQFGVLILAIADAAAEITGRVYGQHHIKIVNKTWEGAAAFFVTGLIIFFLIIWPNFNGTGVKGMLIILTLTVAEIFLTYGLDNLFLPILAAYLVSLII